MKKYKSTLEINSINAAKGDLKDEIDLNWDSIDAADSYVVELCECNGKEKWNLVDIINESKYTITGLKDKRLYKFRVAAVGMKKQGPWSCIVEKKIQ